MGLLSGLMGHAGVVDTQKVRRELSGILLDGENIEQAYKLVRDLIVFTNRRLILTDKQGLTGTKVEYLSIPYRSIMRFAVETAGFLDADSELRIWLSGTHEPIKREFRKGELIVEVHKLLAHYVLK